MDGSIGSYAEANTPRDSLKWLKTLEKTHDALEDLHIKAPNNCIFSLLQIRFALSELIEVKSPTGSKPLLGLILPASAIHYLNTSCDGLMALLRRKDPRKAPPIDSPAYNAWWNRPADLESKQAVRELARVFGFLRERAGPGSGSGGNLIDQANGMMAARGARLLRQAARQDGLRAEMANTLAALPLTEGWQRRDARRRALDCGAPIAEANEFLTLPMATMRVKFARLQKRKSNVKRQPNHKVGR